MQDKPVRTESNYEVPIEFVHEDASSWKDKGNESFKKKNFAEAVLYYTNGLKLDPNNYSLFSNRSIAFLNLQQYYLAYEDAKETIKIQPDWAKGHFRKGEVEFSTFHYLEALLSFTTALCLQPDDPGIKAAIEKTKAGIAKEKQADEQIPWVSAGIGIILGVCIVIATYFLPPEPLLTHPLAMALVPILIALGGYVGGRFYRSCIKNQRSGMLDPPTDLLEEKETKNDEAEKVKHRYTKAQARQRFKKGKS